MKGTTKEIQRGMQKEIRTTYKGKYKGNTMGMQRKSVYQTFGDLAVPQQRCVQDFRNSGGTPKRCVPNFRNRRRRRGDGCGSYKHPPYLLWRNSAGVGVISGMFK